MKRKCRGCGKPFTLKAGKRMTYCSKACVSNHWFKGRALREASRVYLRDVKVL